MAAGASGVGAAAAAAIQNSAAAISPRIAGTAIASDDGEVSDEADGESAEAEGTASTKPAHRTAVPTTMVSPLLLGRRGDAAGAARTRKAQLQRLAREMTQPPETPDIEAEPPPAFDQPERHPATTGRAASPSWTTSGACT